VSDSSSSSGGGGIGFFGLLGILFIGLKLGNVIDWSWWWVLAPIWIPASIAIPILVVIAIYVLRK